MEIMLLEKTSSFIEFIKPYLTWNTLFNYGGSLLAILVLWGVYKLVMKSVNKIPEGKINPQRHMLLKKAIKYLYYTALVLMILSLFGIKLSAVWGAAGIAGVAIGFAAQTSVSNLISGIFVLTEGALKVGDTIIVDGITGVVDTVNLLSVRVHTYDNQMVRIPNSTILNSSLTNNSYFKCRRMTVQVSVAYETDMAKALDVLQRVPVRCPHVLKDPEPKVWFDSFGSSGVALVIAAWFTPAEYLDARNELFIEIKKALDGAEIEIPYDKIDVKVLNG